MIKQVGNSNIKSRRPSALRDFFSAKKGNVDIFFPGIAIAGGGAVQDIRCGGVFTSEYNLGNRIGNERC